jgi:hypothetical protein
MMIIAAAGVGLWLVIVIAALGLCRAASRADRQEDARRVARVSRRGATVGLAVVATTVPAVSSRAQARQLECADRSVPTSRLLLRSVRRSRARSTASA